MHANYVLSTDKLTISYPRPGPRDTNAIYWRIVKLRVNEGQAQLLRGFLQQLVNQTKTFISADGSRPMHIYCMKLETRQMALKR